MKTSLQVISLLNFILFTEGLLIITSQKSVAIKLLAETNLSDQHWALFVLICCVSVHSEQGSHTLETDASVETNPPKIKTKQNNKLKHFMIKVLQKTNKQTNQQTKHEFEKINYFQVLKHCHVWLLLKKLLNFIQGTL